MSKFVSSLDFPARERGDGENDDHLTNTSVVTQDLEDHRTAELLACALRATGHGSLSNVTVTVRTGIVFLEGRVSSFYMKQIAQEIVMRVERTQEVRNHLRVVRE